MTSIPLEEGDKVKQAQLEFIKPPSEVMTVKRVGGVSYPFAVLCQTSSGSIWVHVEDLVKV